MHRDNLDIHAYFFAISLNCFLGLLIFLINFFVSLSVHKCIDENMFAV